MRLQATLGWSACSLIRTVRVHTGAVWCLCKETDVIGQLHTSKGESND